MKKETNEDNILKEVEQSPVKIARRLIKTGTHRDQKIEAFGRKQ